MRLWMVILLLRFTFNKWQRWLATTINSAIASLGYKNSSIIGSSASDTASFVCLIRGLIQRSSSVISTCLERYPKNQAGIISIITNRKANVYDFNLIIDTYAYLTSLLLRLGEDAIYWLLLAAVAVSVA